MVHGQLISHRALDGDDILVLLDVRHVLDEQLQCQSLLRGLGGGRAVIVLVVVIKVNEHLVEPKEQVGDDDVNNGRRHMEREQVGPQVNVPMQRVGTVRLAIEVHTLLLIGQRVVLGP